jgi:hypothetical protein
MQTNRGVGRVQLVTAYGARYRVCCRAVFAALQLNVTVKSTADGGYCKLDTTSRNTCSAHTQAATLLAGFPPSGVYATSSVNVGDALAVMPLKDAIRVGSGAAGIAVRSACNVAEHMQGGYDMLQPVWSALQAPHCDSTREPLQCTACCFYLLLAMLN